MSKTFKWTPVVKRLKPDYQFYLNYIRKYFQRFPLNVPPKLTILLKIPYISGAPQVVVIPNFPCNSELKDNVDDDLFSWYGWSTKGVLSYFPPAPLSEILTIASLWHVASRIWTCLESELRLSWTALRHYGTRAGLAETQGLTSLISLLNNYFANRISVIQRISNKIF